MNEITPIDQIAERAHAAAQRLHETGAAPVNPYLEGSAAAAEFDRRFQMSLMRLSAPVESEASA